jgi:hypothetical protein
VRAFVFGCGLKSSSASGTACQTLAVLLVSLGEVTTTWAKTGSALWGISSSGMATYS